MTEQTTDVNPFAGSPAPTGAVDYGTFSFTVKRYILADLCKHAAVAVPGRESERVPVLACFQVRLGGSPALQVAATDMERTVFTETGTVPWDDTAPETTVYIPARKLLAILEEAPEGDVSIKVAKNKAEISVPGVNWKQVLPDPGGYPKLPVPAAIEFSAYKREELLAALKTIRHAICRDASRSNLTQVQVDAGAITASDGSRLARADLPGFPIDACVPSAAVDDLVKLLSTSPVEDIYAGQTPGLVAFRVGHVILAASKRQNPFPDVESQLIKPTEANNETLAVDKAELAKAIRRVRINADTGTAAIALFISPETVAVVAQDKNGNSAREVVPAKWVPALSAGEMAAERLVVVNHVHLAEAIEAHPGTVCEFQLGKDAGKKRSMVLLSGNGLIQVLSQMPPALVGY